MPDPSRAAVEAGAKALVWEQHQGCVSWEDTTDTATTGSEQTRGYARQHATKALSAASEADPALGFTEEEIEGLLHWLPKNIRRLRGGQALDNGADPVFESAVVKLRRSLEARNG